MSITPNTRPRITRKDAEAYLKGKKISPFEVILLGIRGYYLNTMGDVGVNDRGIYDDALCIMGPEAFVAFNGNTDPSIYRKRVAVLKTGVWQYKPGKHGITFNRPGYPYPAFVQADEVTVVRDGTGLDAGWFGINIHRGSNTTTSSLGCQTVPPPQWDAFHALLNEQLKRVGQKTFKYVLVDA